MAHIRRSTVHTPPPARVVRSPERLERVQPVYFFTPDLEREINKLDGVTSARVLSTGAEIDEIHVIAPRGRTPKKVVRDIESLLLVRFGIRVDHRKISVVQVGQEAAPSLVPSRPQIHKIEKVPSGEGMGVCVEISVNGSFISGIGSHLAHESELHASSRALINSIDKLLNTQGALALQDVSVLEVSDQRIVLAVLSWTVEGQEKILVGATVERGDPLEDAARATLDAVNRKLVRINQAKRARA
jgi:hypothetical protein